MKQSDLTVITKAKDLCSYIMKVTDKSPKKFRYTFVARLQNLALDIIEDLYRANDVFLAPNDSAAYAQRLSLQRRALTNLRILSYFSMLAADVGCLLFKQYEETARLASESMNYLGAWMNSDKRRFQP